MACVAKQNWIKHIKYLHDAWTNNSLSRNVSIYTWNLITIFTQKYIFQWSRNFFDFMEDMDKQKAFCNWIIECISSNIVYSEINVWQSDHYCQYNYSIFSINLITFSRNDIAYLSESSSFGIQIESPGMTSQGTAREVYWRHHTGQCWHSGLHVKRRSPSIETGRPVD